MSKCRKRKSDLIEKVRLLPDTIKYEKRKFSRDHPELKDIEENTFVEILEKNENGEYARTGMIKCNHKKCENNFENHAR